jgi:hypothetical protein
VLLAAARLRHGPMSTWPTLGALFEAPYNGGPCSFSRGTGLRGALECVEPFGRQRGPSLAESRKGLLPTWGESLEVPMRGKGSGGLGGGPHECGTSRLARSLHNRLMGGAEVVSLTRRPPLPKQDSWYAFLLEAESTGSLASIETVRWPYQGIEPATPRLAGQCLTTHVHVEERAGDASTLLDSGSEAER